MPGVFGDTEPPSRIRAGQDRRLARYARRELYAFSTWHRSRLDDAGLGRRGVRGAGDLRRLAPVTLAEAGADRAGGALLRPTLDALRRYGPRRLAVRLALADAYGRLDQLGRRCVDPRYKPVHWTADGGFLVGWSAHDLDRLARLGARWLVGAGVTREDALVSIVPAGPTLAFWELVLGARAAGLSALHLDGAPSSADVVRLQPTVLAGGPLDLLRLAEDVGQEGGARLRSCRTVLAVGEPLDDGLRDRLSSEMPGATVVAAWAPPGVRALWAECHGGDGVHLSPVAEVIEVVDPLSGVPVGSGSPGEVVWTALGWRGTALLRLRTGVFGSLVEGPCPHCRRTSPRFLAAPTIPPFLDVLDRHPGVAAWQAELRTVGGNEELLVFLTPSPSAAADPGGLCRALDEHLSATQYVVVDRPTLDSRLRANDGRRLVDDRPA